MPPLFSKFLTDTSEYANAEAYWAKLWSETPELQRRVGDWKANWFEPQSLKDGNPIFSAISPTDHKAIRVIQYPPTIDGVEFDFWIDTYGGTATDPRAIRELVIACALSPEAAQLAKRVMSSWMAGEIEIASGESILGTTMIRSKTPRWKLASMDESITTPSVIIPDDL